MKHKKITITVPEYLYELLERKVEKGERSAFISAAIEDKIADLTEIKNGDSFAEINKIGQQYSGETTDNLLSSLGR